MTTAAVHLGAIRSREVTKTNIIGIRKALNAYDKAHSLGGSWAKARGLWTDKECGDVLEAIWRDQPKVTGDLHDSGLAVLRNPRYAKRWGDHERYVIENLAEFRLVSFNQSEWARYGNYYPVYQALAPDGERFTFRNIPWQAGGNGPQIGTRNSYGHYTWQEV